jgi:hypothetical protein
VVAHQAVLAAFADKAGLVAVVGASVVVVDHEGGPRDGSAEGGAIEDAGEEGEVAGVRPGLEDALLPAP